MSEHAVSYCCRNIYEKSLYFDNWVWFCRFDRDLQWRTRAQIIPVHCNSSNNFQITREALEVAYKKAEESNIKVKGLIITNPSNPLGTIYDRDTLKSLVNFVNDNNIHLVCDEIYCATVFKSPSFISIAEIIEEMDHCKKELIHILSSLSKDMGLPGFRVGILYSYNDTVVSIARKMSSFGLVSSQTQHLLAAMLSDDEFVDNFLVENSKRLAKRHARFVKLSLFNFLLVMHDVLLKMKILDFDRLIF